MENILTRYYIPMQPDRKKDAAQTHPVNDSKTCNTWTEIHYLSLLVIFHASLHHKQSPTV